MVITLQRVTFGGNKMTKKEFDAMVKQMNQQGLDNDMIMRILYETFATKKCSFEDYELMVNWLGYELTDDFLKAHNIKRNAK